jgi:hypothetical protein
MAALTTYHFKSIATIDKQQCKICYFSGINHSIDITWTLQELYPPAFTCVQQIYIFTIWLIQRTLCTDL